MCDTCVDGIIVDNDSDGDGVCDANEIQGCTEPRPATTTALPPTTDGTLVSLRLVARPAPENRRHWTVVDNDSDDDGVCDADEITGCTDPTACNYDSTPTTDTDNTLCTYVDGVCDTCVDGLIVDNDSDGDGVCDANEVQGCTDALPATTTAQPPTTDGSCVSARLRNLLRRT